MITGASSGIGEQIARNVNAAGGRVVLGARRGDRLEALCKELGGSERATFKVTDVTKKDDLHQLADHGRKHFGIIDALVNNAGIAPTSPIAARDTDSWDRMIDCNIKGLLYGVDAVWTEMMNRGSGHIVDICSVAGHEVFSGWTVYCATKFAVRAISKGLRQEGAGRIAVTNISPGMFESEIWQGMTHPEAKQSAEAMLNTAQPPERVAECVVFALSRPEGVCVNELTISPRAQF